MSAADRESLTARRGVQRSQGLQRCDKPASAQFDIWLRSGASDGIGETPAALPARCETVSALSGPAPWSLESKLTSQTGLTVLDERAGTATTWRAFVTTRR